MINFDATKDEFDLIIKIVDRAFADLHLPDGNSTVLVMDITACHMNGCPLDLEAILNADHFNFAHDVAGIINHLDRKTGRLTRGFLPRMCAK